MTRRTQEQTTHFQKKLQYAARRRVFAIVLCSVILFIVSQYAVTLASNERNAGIHFEQLANSLAAALGRDKEAIQQAIAACGLPPTIRGEALTLEDLARLSESLSDNKI